MNTEGKEIEQISDSKENNSFSFQIDIRTIGFTQPDSLHNQEKSKIDIITKKEEKLGGYPMASEAKWSVDNLKETALSFNVRIKLPI